MQYIDWIDRNLIPHINYQRETDNHTIIERVGELALNMLVMTGIAASIYVFPELTVIGFTLGVCMSDQVRDVSNKMVTLLKDLNFFYQFEATLMGILSVPVLFVSLPIFLGSYMWWSAEVQSDDDPNYFKRG